MRFKAAFDQDLAEFLDVDRVDVAQWREDVEVGGLVFLTGWSLEYIDELSAGFGDRLLNILWSFQAHMGRRL